MKPDYKNWVPKGMVYGLAGGTLAAFAAFLILGATGIILHGTPRLVCGIIFGIGTLVLLFFTVWMGALHKTFDDASFFVSSRQKEGCRAHPSKS